VNANVSGGAGGATSGSIATPGAGGVGIVGSAMTLNINNATVSGGSGAFAVNFLGGTNVLALTGTGSLVGGINMAGASSLEIAPAVATTTSLANVISGTGSLIKDGAGTLVLSGANTFSGGITVAGGTLSLGSNTAAGTGTITTTGSVIDYAVDGMVVANPININSNDTQLQVLAGISATQSGDISETGGPRPLEKIGDGTLVLTGNNTYTGVTTVSAGTLVAGSANALGTTAGGTIVESGANLTISNVAIGAEALTLNGGSSLTGTGVASLAGTVALVGDNTVTVGATDELTLSGIISGAAGDDLIKAGNGALTLSGASTYTGDTIVNAGTLNITGSVASLVVTGNGTGVIQVDGASLADTAAVTLNDTSNLTLTGAETIGSLAGAAGATVTLGANTLTTGGAGTSTSFAGVISGTGGLTKAGAGTMTLTGVNTSTGPTPLSAGALALTGSGAIASTSISTAAGATLSTDGGALNNNAVITSNAGSLAFSGSETINAITASTGNISVSGGTLTLDDGVSNIAGVISGSGGLTITGTSDTTLSGTHTYTGATTVTAGTLNNSGTIAGVANISGGTATNNGTIAGAATISGTGTLTNTTTGQLASVNNQAGGTFSNANNVAGQVGAVTNAGTGTNTGTIASLTNSAGTFGNSGTITGAASISGGTVTNTGTITGAVGLSGGTLNTTGTLGSTLTNAGVVNASGTINGAVVNSGTFNATGALASNGAFTNNAGATLNLNAGIYALGGNLDNSGGITVAAPATLDMGPAFNLTNNAGGTITNNGTITDALINAGVVTNNGTYNAIVQSNSGTITNNGTWTGDVLDNTGTINAFGAWSGSVTNNAGGLWVATNGVTTLGGVGNFVNNTGNVAGRGISLVDGATGDIFNTAGQLSGTGTINLDVNLSNTSSSDFVNAQGGHNGVSNIYLNQIAPLGFDAAPVTLLQHNGTPGTINVANLPDTNGLISYSVQNTGTAWVLQATPDLAAIGGIASNVSLVQSIIGTVVNRPSSPFVSGLAGDQDPNTCGLGPWARATGGGASATGTSTGMGGSSTSEVNIEYAGVQAGVDLACFNVADKMIDASFGIIAGMNQGASNQPLKNAAGNVFSTTIGTFDQGFAGIYATAARGPFSADLQFRVDDTTYTFNNPTLGFNDASTRNQRYSLNGSMSYAFTMDDLSIVPAAGFSISHTTGSSIGFANGTQTLNLDPSNSYVGFVGGTIARTFFLPDGMSVAIPFVTATIYNDFAADPTASFVINNGAGNNVTSQNLDAFGELSLGVNYARILEGQVGNGKQFNGTVRADAKFSDRLLGAGVTGQVRVQF